MIQLGDIDVVQSNADTGEFPVPLDQISVTANPFHGNDVTEVAGKLAEIRR